VPEGTQSGKELRMRSKGMPVMRSSQKGDLYIRIAVETPQHLSRRQKELLEEFQEISSNENNPESSGFFSKMKGFFDTLSD
jgi:molecular chaperone DnaJ